MVRAGVITEDRAVTSWYAPETGASKMANKAYSEWSS
jgi:hypothetical protein